MIKGIYALRDVKSYWTDPFVDDSDESAIRGVELMVKRADPNSLICFKPKDFDLYKIGEYDTVSGELFLENTDHMRYPYFLVNAGQIGGVQNAES